jgi:hypothetical protein
MTQNNNILQELVALGSTLPPTIQNAYSVPDGYFDELIGQVLSRIKAMEAGNAVEELSVLSPLLSGLSKQTPYTVPADYFSGLEQRLLLAVKGTDQTAQEELESISPLLGSLKKETPYSIPAGYFETLNTGMSQPAQQEPAKVISLTSRKWFRYAAAAMITGIVALALVLVFKRPVDPAKDLAKFEKKLNKEIKKTSDKELADFIQYTEAAQDVAVNVPKEEVKELLKDVPATELQNFLDEIADPELSADDKAAMD